MIIVMFTFPESGRSGTTKTAEMKGRMCCIDRLKSQPKGDIRNFPSKQHEYKKRTTLSPEGGQSRE